MAYVKLDKELATAVANTLEDINEQISITLSSLSSSFLNKKVALGSSFLIKRDENDEIYADFTRNAISHNAAADNGSQRAIALKANITKTISKVVTSLNKVVSLVESFESQSGMSLEAEMGADLSSAFQFLAVYGDASSLSDLKGSGMFGHSSLNGIYSFDDSILNFDGLSVWSTFGGFLNENEEETEGEGGLENDIREFFLGKLEGYINEDGDVVIDGKNLGTLNSLSMTTLLETDAGQQMKSEFEEDYKDKLSMLLYGEAASNDDEMDPFAEQASNLAAAGALLIGGMGNIGNGTTTGSVDKDQDDKKGTTESVKDGEVTEEDDDTGNTLLNEVGNIFDKATDALKDSLNIVKSDGKSYFKFLKIDENGNEVYELIEIPNSPPVEGPGDLSSSVTEGFGEESENPSEVVGGEESDSEESSEVAGGIIGETMDRVQDFTQGVIDEVTDHIESSDFEIDIDGDGEVEIDFNNSEISNKVTQAGAQSGAEAGLYIGAQGAASGLIGGNGKVNADGGIVESGSTTSDVSQEEVIVDKVTDSKENTSTSESSAPTTNQSTTTQTGAANGTTGGTSTKPVSSSNINTNANSAPTGNVSVENNTVQETVVTQKDNTGVESGVSMESGRKDTTLLPELPGKKNDGGGSVVTEKPSEPVETPKPAETPKPVDDGKIKGSATIAAGAGAAAIIGTSNPSAATTVPTTPTAPTTPTVDVNISNVPAANPTPVTTTPNVGTDSSVSTIINNNASGAVANAATNPVTNTPNNAVSNVPASNGSTVNSGTVTNDAASSNNQNVPSKGTTSSASTTTHATESSSSNNGLGKGKSSYSGGGSTSSSSSSSSSKSNVTDSKANIEKQDQTNIEDFDKKVDLSPSQGVIGDSSYTELIIKNEKEVKIATGVTVSSLAVTLALKLTNVIGIVSCILVMLAIALLYSTFRIKKGKERKKLESLIKIEKVNKEAELKKETEEQKETNTDTTDEENVIYQEEVVYVDENGNEIELTEDAKIVSEEIIVEETEVVKEEVPNEKKEFQSAEEVIYGDKK